jgi:sulfatase maturation enzyme AslB (radical SAM superfamily)
MLNGLKPGEKREDSNIQGRMRKRVSMLDEDWVESILASPKASQLERRVKKVCQPCRLARFCSSKNYHASIAGSGGAFVKCRKELRRYITNVWLIITGL